ncbi:FKBP-type peptidyl-prolyl cis-trans isomerase [Niabella drilacis]|uniref:Peptidyl-prolyl cis-trans isomerase n=1 Tax=Niabella drilacis (strain DSM 25811 / CCM 8410 / CCUG 62505 / LMG 26954 / E90) TaxID=1285928 RepID=A0A1G6SI79_NIADE|nr:FKBP-type peptidyl-prolyl cis-trans isomerase [Niabella drilacis]SDD16374.1 FKBP-type peptidyl-prolyl cis-trans isomerase FkpA [Niabella drilacis]
MNPLSTNKKIYAGLAVLLGLAIIGCIKDENAAACEPKAAVSDTAQMKKFIRDSAITADSNKANWLMWQVMDAGTGTTPGPNSQVTVKYMGRLLTGAGFDSSYTKSPEGAVFRLNKIIPGWYLGLAKIKEGGRIKLLLPSALAYGCDPRYGSLTNQPLFFDIELIKVEN